MAVVEAKRHGRVLVVRMNRPERLNALSHEMRSELAKTWTEFPHNGNNGVLVNFGTIMPYKFTDATTLVARRSDDRRAPSNETVASISSAPKDPSASPRDDRLAAVTPSRSSAP